MPDREALLLAAVGAAAVVLLAVVLATSLVRQWRKSAKNRAPERSEGDGACGEALPPSSFRTGLAKTRQALAAHLRAALGRDRTLDGWLRELEEALVMADVGVPTTERLLAAVRQRTGLASADSVLQALREEVGRLLQGPEAREPEARPLVILVAGVNGVGKTTTIGKLAHRYHAQGRRALLVAADTFRAAAVEQLEVWAHRVGCDLVKHEAGSDPSAVVFDGLRAACTRGADIAIVDTAGRLHVKVNLMEELKKIVRVMAREVPGAPHEAFLVLDATTGQNALSQARLFRDALPLTGVILTKLDGTAKGGCVLAVKSELGLPIRYVGLGEGIDDLRPFDPAAFAEALFDS